MCFASFDLSKQELWPLPIIYLSPAIPDPLEDINININNEVHNILYRFRSRHRHRVGAAAYSVYCKLHFLTPLERLGYFYIFLTVIAGSMCGSPHWSYGMLGE